MCRTRRWEPPPAPEPSPVLLGQLEKAGFRLSELMDQARLALAASFPRAVWVIGEVQNLNRRSSGVFLNLAEQKDQGSGAITINATIWTSTFRDLSLKHGEALLQEVLAEGLSGRFLCQVQLYRDRGSISLNILDLDPQFTKGALALAREQLLKELRQKGLDQLNKQKTLTDFPLKIGLISAPESRAQSDFLHQLLSYGFPGEVLFYPAQMQGEGVLTSIPKALSALNQAGCDVVVMTRGGGSASDLRWFDSREVALAVAQSPCPVISAIGHHDDVCVAELISFRHEKTPTAAADFLLERIRQTRNALETMGKGMTDQLRARLEGAQRRHHDLVRALDQVSQTQWERRLGQLRQWARLLEKAPRERVRRGEGELMKAQHFLQAIGTKHCLARESSRQQWAQRLKNLSERMILNQSFGLDQKSEQLKQKSLTWCSKFEGDWAEQRSSLQRQAERSLASLREAFEGLAGRLRSLDPSPWVKKGWSQLRVGKTRLTSVKGVQIGQKVEAILQDGKVAMSVENISEG